MLLLIKYSNNKFPIHNCKKKPFLTGYVSFSIHLDIGQINEGIVFNIIFAVIMLYKKIISQTIYFKSGNTFIICFNLKTLVNSEFNMTRNIITSSGINKFCLESNFSKQIFDDTQSKNFISLTNGSLISSSGVSIIDIDESALKTVCSIVAVLECEKDKSSLAKTDLLIYNYLNIEMISDFVRYRFYM